MRIHVAVGVIKNNKQEILIAKRAAHLHQGGLWEFPGGKVEQGETVRQALSRELHEELGIVVEEAQPFTTIVHDYPDKSVLLDVWLVEKFSGQARSNESQPLLWIPVTELISYAFPEANRDIVRILKNCYKPLHDTILITGSYGDIGDYTTKLQTALVRGVQWVQLRAHHCNYDEYRALYDISSMLCKEFAAQLTVNTTANWFHQLQAPGLHLTSARLLTSHDRPVSKSILLGASCHNHVEIQQAKKIDVDYITLGPVFRTATHPTQEPIGLDIFSDWVKKTDIPVFALGGAHPEKKDSIKKIGGYGVAGISGYWDS